MAVVSKNSK